MPNEIRLTHRFNRNSALVQTLIHQGAVRVERAMEGITDEIVNEVEGLIREEFETNREGYRKKAGPHLSGSIKAEVTSTPGQFPVRVEVWSTDPDQIKVASLESGTKGHHIYPTKGKKFLFFPSNTAGFVGNKAIPSGELFKRGSVFHPPTPGRHFLKRGLDKVVDRRLRSL